MLIILHIFIALAFLYFSGFGFFGLMSLIFGKEKPLPGAPFIVPITGYCLSQLTFWYGYALFGNSRSALILTVVLFFLLNLFYFYLAKSRLSNWRTALVHLIPEKKDASLLLALGGIFALAVWPYFLIGEGHYFHSGNEDFFDAITGGYAYYLNNPFELLQDEYKLSIRIQYSSQAFWRLFLSVGGMDAFLLQSILNLLLTAIGVYWLVRFVFLGSQKSAVWIAFWSVATNFYFTTYLAGHVGSMIYSSVAPVLLGVFLLVSRKALHAGWFGLVCVFYYFLSITFREPIYFLIIPALLLAFHEHVFSPFGFWQKVAVFLRWCDGCGKTAGIGKLRWGRILLIGLLLVLLGVILVWWIWLYFEPGRMDTLYRETVSWKITLYKEMWNIFWGIFPSNLVGAVSPLPLLISDEYINMLALFVSIILSVMTLWGGLLNRCKNERQFLFLYLCLFPPFFVIMRYFWGHPYYTYKFLYANFFVVVIVLGLWLAERGSAGKLWKQMSILTLTFCIGANLFWDISRELDILNRPYHQKAKIDDFLRQVNKEQLKRSVVDIPDEVNSLVFRYILYNESRFTEQGGIPVPVLMSKARYLIQLQNIQDVSHNLLAEDNVIYDNGLLRLIEQSTHDNLYVSSSFSPDNFGQLSLRWIGNELSVQAMKFNKWAEDVIEFIRQAGMGNRTFINISEEPRYLFMQKVCQNKQVSLQLDPRKANWFLRWKLWTGPGGDVYLAQYYAKVPGEKIVYENTIFQLVEAPSEKRRLTGTPKIDFSSLISEIKRRGGEVFIDIPLGVIFLYLEEVLRSQGIRISNSPDAPLVCSTGRLGPAAIFYDRTLTHPQESILWQHTYENIYQRLIGIDLNIQLISMPKEGRLRTERDPKEGLWLSHAPRGFHIYISRLMPEARHLRILLAPGPSINFSRFSLLVRSDDGKVLKSYQISPPTTCIDLPLAEFAQQSGGDLSLHFEGEDLIGHSLLPIEERILDYAVLAVELTDQVEQYSPFLKSILNKQISLRYDPILDKFLKKKESGDVIAKPDINKIALGTGWYPYETFNGESFRWVGSEAQILLDSLESSDHTLTLNLEPGPGCGGAPLNLKVSCKDQMLYRYQVFGRESLTLKLPDDVSAFPHRQTVLRLSAETPNVTIDSDPRVLNFRVFGIRLVSGTSLVQSKSSTNGKTP